MYVHAPKAQQKFIEVSNSYQFNGKVRVIHFNSNFYCIEIIKLKKKTHNTQINEGGIGKKWINYEFINNKQFSKAFLIKI